MNTSIFVPSSRRVNICCVPSIHISQFISATIREPGVCWVLAQWAPAGRSCTWNIHCGHRRGGEDKVTPQTPQKRLNTNSRRHNTHHWPEDEARIVDSCVVWVLGKWKMTGAIKFERMDCQTGGKQVFWGHCDTDTVCWQWCDIISSSLPTPLLYLTHSTSTLAAFHAHINNDSSNIWIRSWFWNNGLNVISSGESREYRNVRKGKEGSWAEESYERRKELIRTLCLIFPLLTFCICCFISTKSQQWTTGGSEVWDVNEEWGAQSGIT